MLHGMRIAIPQWQGRISPVLDTATQLLVAEPQPDGRIRREQHALKASDTLGRASELVRLGVEVVLCGAVSATLASVLASAGVRVLAFLCGPVDEILQAWLAGSLLRHSTYAMPGCQRWRRRARWRVSMAKGFGGGTGCPGGRAGAGGRGSMGGRKAAGPRGECICPNCGARAPHLAGQPCKDSRCPNCGTAMTRA